MTLSVPKIINVSPDGFSLLLDDEELRVPFDMFPGFAVATVDQLRDLEQPSSERLRWPQLDIDLSIESVRHPEAFSLVARLERIARPLDTTTPARFELAPKDHIAPYEETARRFFREVLDENFDECLVTDESFLTDFASCGLPDEIADPTTTLCALHAAWDRWILGELKARFGLEYETPAVPLLNVFRDIEAVEDRRQH